VGVSDVIPVVDASPAARVASIVEYPSGSAFVLLLQLSDRHFADAGFEDAVAAALRERTELIGLWQTSSADQKWTPSAYVEQTETGWYDGGRQLVRAHPDQAAAVADYIHRMAAWRSRRVVLGERPQGRAADPGGDRLLLHNLLDSLDRLYDRDCGPADVYMLLNATAAGIKDQSWITPIGQASTALVNHVRSGKSAEEQYKQALIVTNDLRLKLAGYYAETSDRG
jgi:hypothetical protein